MRTLDALREWLDRLADAFAPRPRPVAIAVERRPRPVRRPPKPAGGMSRPLKG